MCRWELMGSVHQRLSGTGVVQFATAVDSNATGDRDAAIKFYIKRAAFDRVASEPPPLTAFARHWSSIPPARVMAPLHLQHLQRFKVRARFYGS